LTLLPVRDMVGKTVTTLETALSSYGSSSARPVNCELQLVIADNTYVRDADRAIDIPSVLN